MGDKVWFATVDWNGYELADNPIPSCYKSAEWNAKNSSPFTGFPFPGIFGNVYELDTSLESQSCPTDYYNWWWGGWGNLGGYSRIDFFWQVSNVNLKKIAKENVKCGEDEMKIWDGTYFEKKDTKISNCSFYGYYGSEGSEGSYNSEIEYDIKYPSSKKDKITPVCGSGTPIIKMKRQTLAEWIWRIKYLDIESCDINWNESITWNGSGSHGNIESEYNGDCHSDGSASAYLNLNGSFTKKNDDSTLKDTSTPPKRERDILKNKHPEYKYSTYNNSWGGDSHRKMQGFVSYNKITNDRYKNGYVYKYEPDPAENLTVDADLCISSCSWTKCKDDDLTIKQCGYDSWFPWISYNFYDLTPIEVPERDYQSVCVVQPLSDSRGLNCFFINDPDNDPYNKYVYVDVRGLIEFRIDCWLHKAWIGFAEISKATQKITGSTSKSITNATLCEVERYQYSTLSIDFFGKETVHDIPIIVMKRKQSVTLPTCCCKTCCEWEWPNEENKLEEPKCVKEEDAPCFMRKNIMVDPVLNFSISGGKLVLKGKEYWEYGNKDGSPIYNKDTGEKILDPIMETKIKT